MAFDKTRDRFNNGTHLDYDNNYITAETKNSKVSAVMQLNKAEVEELIKSSKINTDSTVYPILMKLNTRTEFKVSRDLKLKTYFFEHDGFSPNENMLIAKYLVQLFPYILYFDDFTDRVPAKINIPSEYHSGMTFRKSKQSEWQAILVEIFKRANTDLEGSGEDALEEYLRIVDQDTKDDMLSDIQSALNKEIIEEWKKIKKSGKALADDSEKLSLSIKHEGNEFMFKVKDKARVDKTRTFSVAERSKGFQWFFNYMIKLKFNPNYKSRMDNTLFLLDEPGSYLHSAAQSELLKELKKVSNKNTIIYCTHSQYLLNPSVINLGSIRIAGKSGSKITLQNYGNYKETKNTGALSAIHQALQINYSPEFKGKIIITEGVTDFYFFKMLQAHTRSISKTIRFIPGAGAAQSAVLISFSLSFSNCFRVLLDNDEAGKSAYKKYIKQFSKTIEPMLHIYNKQKAKFVLEDFLSKDEKTELMAITNCKDVKRAIGFLYYDYKAKQPDFINSLSDESKEKLQDCFTLFSEMK